MIFSLAFVPLLLLLLGFPIYLVLLTAATTALVFFMNMPLLAVHQNLFGSIDSFALLAIPFFIYAGELMGRGTVARRIVEVVQAGVGGVRGSTALTAVGTSVIFGAISGASAATVATVGQLMLPNLRKDGYSEQFSAGLITAVGAIDIIIPPSIPMIVYGVAASESVPRLYAAGVLPGLLIAAILAVYVFWYASRNNISVRDRFALKSFLIATSRGLWALGAPIIILGGIYGGVFSPTEAAGIACVYAALVTRVVYRELSWGEIVQIAGNTAILSSQILIILACASVYSWILTVHQVPVMLVETLQAFNLAPWMILLAINTGLLVVGSFIDPLSAILVLSPLLVPVIKAAGIDTIHFGIIVMVNLAIGMFHPPFGINIFVAQSVMKFPLGTIYKGILPFLALYLIALLLITYIPPISLLGVNWLLAK